MTLYFGDKEVKPGSLYYGSKQVPSLYFGDKLVYQNMVWLDKPVQVWRNIAIANQMSNLLLANNYIYVNCFIVKFHTLKKVDLNGKLIWAVNSNDNPVPLGVDKLDNLYYTDIDDFTLVKVDSSENQIWKKTAPSYIAAFTVDDQNNIYYSDDTKMFYKCDSAGNEIWKKSTNEQIRYAHTDEKQDLYVVGTGNHIIEYNPEGTVIWDKKFEGKGMPTIDYEGNIYYLGNLSVVKLDSNGNQLWTKTLADQGYKVIFDSLNNIYVWTYNDNSKNSNLIKLDSDSNEIWSYNLPSRLTSMVIDKDFNIYYDLGNNSGLTKLRQI